MVDRIELSVYAKISENNSWDSENFDAVKSLYPEQTIEEKVQKVITLVLESVKAAHQIKGFWSCDLITATQRIQQERDSKRSPENASIPELIENATPLQRYIMVKVINCVTQEHPAMQKADIVAASLLFGISKVCEESQSLSAGIPAASQPAPQEATIREQIVGTLDKLKAMRAQFTGDNPFLGQVDAMIALHEQKLAQLD